MDEYGIAKINGEFNTADPKAFTDVNVIFRNVEMSHLTPYSGKFAGRKIDPQAVRGPEVQDCQGAA